MTGQAKNTAYEVSKAEELQSTNQTQSGSVFSPIGAFFTRHRSLALSLSSVLSVLVIWYLITVLKIVPSLFYQVHKRYGKSSFKLVNKAL